MSKPYHDADWLREQYHGRGRTQREIAEECGVSPRAIRKWMNRHEIETREVRGENHGLYGQERDEEVKEQISETMEGREMSKEWRERIAESHTGTTIPDEVREQIAHSLNGLTRPEETRRKMSEARKGQKNPMYVDGESGYYGPEWSFARRQANERDEVCQACGADDTESRLEVHHIVPFNRFRQAEETDLSDGHELSNLVLLCRSCHMRAEHGDLSFESGIEDPLDD
jgi:5-methylcytosine-specific restriction endonuclease McrA